VQQRGRNMKAPSYETAETLVYDPISANRTATRSALFSLGFRKIESVSTVEALAAALRIQPPDLVLAEAQGTEGPLCDIIQATRQGSGAPNPFLVIVVTAWEKNESLVGRVVNSGADDLLLRPFSTALLGRRIAVHIESRKEFVITSEYVGPDRRKDVSRFSDVNLFAPPNSLKMKVAERLSPEEASQRLGEELRAARTMLNIEKLRRDAFQICVLWRLLQERTPGAQRYQADLAKVASLARAVERRCRECDRSTALQWCEAIRSAVEGLEFGVDVSASMHLLGQAALNIYQSLSPQKPMSEHLAELDATVAMIHARDAKKLAS
jgi:DNA-binding response OmpR family regulator